MGLWNCFLVGAEHVVGFLLWKRQRLCLMVNWFNLHLYFINKILENLNLSFGFLLVLCDGHCRCWSSSSTSVGLGVKTAHFTDKYVWGGCWWPSNFEPKSSVGEYPFTWKMKKTMSWFELLLFITKCF